MSTYREKGGQYFKESNYGEALKCYSKAILDEPTEKIHFSNRSLCYIKLEFYKPALLDAEKCIQLDPTFAKGYYRKATAHAALGELSEAIDACKLAKKYAPNDKLVSEMLKGLQEKRKQQLFLEAIHEDEKPTTINWRNMDGSGSVISVPDDKPIGIDKAMEIITTMKNRAEFGKCVVHKKHVLRILEEAKDILSKRSVLQEITTDGKKMTIVGDIHGQFYDLLNLFEKNGYPSEDNIYLFNGDYVDRGSFGVECVLTLFLMMIVYPNSLYLARGNHETPNMNSLYGFEGEVKAKYGSDVFNVFKDVFIQLPYCHVIDTKVFVVHGGIPPVFITLDDIRKVQRVVEPKEGSIANAMLWADPQTYNGSQQSIRGSGKTFGPDITLNFLNRNNLEYIVRSHEMKMNGFEYGAEGRLVTVFSAPNYCDQMKNKGAYIHVKTTVDENGEKHCSLTPNVFEAVPHPNIRAMAYASFGGAF